MSGYWTYRAAALLSRALPENLAYWFGLRVADCFYRRDHAGRAAVIANLRRIFAARGVVPAEGALTGLTRKTYQNFGKYLVDFFRFSHLSPEELHRRVSLEHLEHLEEVARAGRGALLVTAHFGNWELAGAVLSAKGYRINAVELPQRLEKLNRLLRQQRERRGMHLIEAGGSSISRIIRCLRRGEFVALLADRDFTGRDDRIEFFGAPARLPLGPAWLAHKLQVPILPGFMLRQVDDSFLLRCYPPIWPEREGGVQAIREKICRILEREIGEYPYQWFVFEDFWAGAGGPPPGRGTTV